MLPPLQLSVHFDFYIYVTQTFLLKTVKYRNTVKEAGKQGRKKRKGAMFCVSGFLKLIMNGHTFDIGPERCREEII
jgi:hypothetical protein